MLHSLNFTDALEKYRPDDDTYWLTFLLSLLNHLRWNIWKWLKLNIMKNIHFRNIVHLCRAFSVNRILTLKRNCHAISIQILAPCNPTLFLLHIVTCYDGQHSISKPYHWDIKPIEILGTSVSGCWDLTIIGIWAVGTSLSLLSLFYTIPLHCQIEWAVKCEL